MMPSGASALALAIAVRTSSMLSPIDDELHRIDAHADGRLLGAGDRHLRHAVDLRDALGDDGVGRVVEVARRQRLGGQRQDQDGRGRRVRLAEPRQRRHVGRQVGRGGVEGGLHVRAAPSMLRLRANWMVMRVEPSELTEVISLTPAISPSRRSSGAATRGRHGLGVGAGQAGSDADGGELDRGQARTGRKR